MDENRDKLNNLLQRFESLIERQESFSNEINELKKEIKKLQQDDIIQSSEKESIDRKIAAKETQEIIEERYHLPNKPAKSHDAEITKQSEKNKSTKSKTDLEKFIGENLTNKIGIVITIIGVTIGTKYSIEHELLSPLSRIILGYFAGVTLLGVGIKLKSNYKNYSAVLVSGAMTIMYFITYSAYSFYALIPITPAFLLMVVFTIFTVIASLSYNNLVIALIGLVGAYAVPFLLSEHTGNVKILFGYMTIINTGILVIAFRKYWKMLYYASLFLSWTIFVFWFLTDYKLSEHFGLALIFSSLFFLTFYVTFLAYKLKKEEEFLIDDVILLIINSFIFYGIGYAILENHEVGAQSLGLFTLVNALLHLIMSMVIFQQKLADRNLFYLISGLALVFITIAIPVQLEGRWVTLLWVGEAALLFMIGRTKDTHVYERLSYPLMLLAFISLIQDWTIIYGRFIPNDPESMITPFLNVHFLSSVLFILAFGIIVFIYLNKAYQDPVLPNLLNNIIRFAIPGILLFTLFYAIRLEIANYWNQLFALSTLEIKIYDNEYLSTFKNYDLKDFKSVWIINYALLFFTALSLLNILKIKSSKLGLANLALNAFFLGIFLVHGLYALSDLRESYLSQDQSAYYQIGVYNLFIRYISFAFAGAIIVISYTYLKQKFLKKDLRMAFGTVMHVAIVWMLSSELIQWLDITGTTQSYKLGLSILWGSYSLIVIILGIWKNLKYLRIGAFSLFALTLVKLFVYDISSLETIPKTIVFVSLGILLLMISFLYNKYKHKIADEDYS